jgi:hypothetical protein
LTRVTDGLSRQLNKRDVDAALDLMSSELCDEPRMTFLFTKDADKRLKLTRVRTELPFFGNLTIECRMLR